MKLKKYLFIFIVFCGLCALASCGKKQEADMVLSANPDKYGCVMLMSIDDTNEVLEEKKIGPDGVFKYNTPFGNDEKGGSISCETATSAGERFSHEIVFGENESVDAVGFNSLGEALVIMCKAENGEDFFTVERRGENNETSENVKIPKGYGAFSFHSEVYEDPYGYIHIGNIERTENGNPQNGYIILKDGEIVYQKDSVNLNGACKIIVLPDKSAAVDLVTDTSGGRINHEIIKYNPSDSSNTTICCYSTAEMLKDDEILAINVFDENQLVYFTCNGVFLSDYKLKKPELIFDWHKNGMSFPQTVTSFEEYRVCANDAGDIFVLKDEYKCDDYLKLSKLPDNIISIEIAGASGSRSYSEAVCDFNVRHPEYHITIRDDFDETNLLVKMTAGEGPEMVEAGVFDVRAQKNAWELLENLISKDTIDCLNKGAVISGNIDGELYGAASSFWIDTLVTGEDLDSWDYDTFLKQIENNKNLQTITSNSLLEGKLQAFEFLFCDGVDDTYFLNPNEERNVIIRDNLERVVSLMDQYQSNENMDKNCFDMVTDGLMFCARFLVTQPADIYNIAYAFGERGNIIGYPGKNGLKHYIYDSGSLFVRKNISEEKRKLVSEFLEFMFSYDEQKKILVGSFNDSFSARNDVLNEQIDSIKDKEGEKGSLGGVTFTYKDIDTEAVRKEINDIMENSSPGRDWNDSLYIIIDEELDGYFSGDMDMDALEDHLNKRIKTYLEERK